MILKTFGWSFSITALGFIMAGILWGWHGLAIVAILSILEISLSFDNAVINAGILKKMNAFWQQIFLTIGIAIAVFGMRLVFPIIIVAVSAGLSPFEAVQLAITNKEEYEHLITAAHAAIAAFGGMFLLMIFLDFVVQDREHKWFAWLEKRLARLGEQDAFSVTIALVVLLITALFIAPHAAHGSARDTVLVAGIAGLVTYLIVNGLSRFFEKRMHRRGEAITDGQKKGKIVPASGKVAFMLFMYLEVIDATFSFDGVIGAFAITNDIFIMALGLGIGALYIRSLTVYLVRQGTLDAFVFLEHGAHYAIGALALILIASIQYPIPEIVTGLLGVVLILLSFWSSVQHNKRMAALPLAAKK